MYKDSKLLVDDLGLTGLEASVYLTVLANPDITGYKVSKELDKPVPNTYKALQSLKKRGLLSSWNSDRSEKFFALPLKDYFDQVETELAIKRKRIEKLLKRYRKLPSSARVYEFENLNQLFQKIESFLPEADNIILLDASPKILKLYKEKLKNSPKSRLKVFVKTYANEVLNGCVSIKKSRTDPTQEWPFEWFIMTVDGQKLILAFLEKDLSGILQGFWSESVFLTTQIHSGLANEFILTIVSDLLANYKYSDAAAQISTLKSQLLLDETLVGGFINDLHRG